MVPITAFAAGGWWAGFTVTSVLLAALASLVVTVICVVNRLERQAGSILDHLVASGEASRPLLDLVEANVHIETITKGRR